MKELFLAIKTQLETEVPEIKHINIWNDQLRNVENGQHYFFDFPAVFVELVTGESTQLGKGYQIFDPLGIRIHIVHQQIDTGDGSMERNFDVFDLKKKIYIALNKFQPDGASSFMRYSDWEDYDHTNLYHAIQEYKCSYIDGDREEPLDSVETTPPTDIQIELTIENSDDPNEPYIIPE